MTAAVRQAPQSQENKTVTRDDRRVKAKPGETEIWPGQGQEIRARVIMQRAIGGSREALYVVGSASCVAVITGKILLGRCELV